MSNHQSMSATPTTKRAEILQTYDQAHTGAARLTVGGVLTHADLHGLRRRVATICAVSVDQVSDAIATRDMQARLVRSAAARPRHPITRGIE